MRKMTHGPGPIQTGEILFFWVPVGTTGGTGIGMTVTGGGRWGVVEEDLDFLDDFDFFDDFNTTLPSIRYFFPVLME